MRWITALLARLRSLFNRAGVEDELDAELRFHVEQGIEENRAAGMSAREARASGLRSVGSTALESKTRHAAFVWLTESARLSHEEACS